MAISKSEVSAVLSSARALRFAKRFGEAEKLLVELVIAQPRAGDVWQELGTVYYQQRKLDRAIDAYGKRLDCDPEDAIGHYSLAAALAAAGNALEAAKHVAMSLKIDPNFDPAKKLRNRLSDTPRNPVVGSAEVTQTDPRMWGRASAVRIRNEQRSATPTSKHSVQVVDFRLIRSQGLPPVSVQMSGTELTGTLVEGDEIILTGKIPEPGRNYVTGSIRNLTSGGMVILSNRSAPSFFVAHPNVLGFAFVIGVVLLIIIIARARH